jgi:hypothetical protein
VPVRTSRRKTAVIDGRTILYHYLQKDLIANDIWLFQMLTARLVVSLGIWLHPSVYERLPMVLPFAVRDPYSRGHKPTGVPDQWGSADATGLFRDDNSLIKGLPRSMTVASGRPNHIYDGRSIGNGFVASHVWRVTGNGLAARDRRLYSFVPNLVWLPADVAKLSDREGSFVQTFLQALAVKIYRRHSVRTSLNGFVDDAWAHLPEPKGVPEQGLPHAAELNYFTPSDAWFRRRQQTIASVVEALDLIQADNQPPHTVAERYAPSLALLTLATRQELRSRLTSYLDALA